MHPRVMFVVLFLSLSFTISESCAQDDSSSVGAMVHHDIDNVWHHSGTYFTAPLHFTGKDWITTGAVLGGTVLLFTFDESSRSIAHRNQSSQADHVFELGREYGREVYGLALAGGCYIGGMVFKNEGVRKTGLMVFESIAFAGITTTLIKVIMGRSRPYEEEGAHRFNGLSLENKSNSLPSGHATVAFAVSSVLAERFHNTYASVGLYSLAALTATSRIYHDEHWLSDTFLGAAIGTVSGLYVAQFYDDQQRSMSLSLFPTKNGFGLLLNF